jgi:hypothetical protein
MNPTPPEKPKGPEPGPDCWVETNSLNTIEYYLLPPERQPQPLEGVAETDSLNTIVYFFDGVGDTTIRPMRSPVLGQIRPLRRPEPPPAKP